MRGVSNLRVGNLCGFFSPDIVLRNEIFHEIFLVLKILMKILKGREIIPQCTISKRKTIHDFPIITTEKIFPYI